MAEPSAADVDTSMLYSVDNVNHITKQPMDSSRDPSVDSMDMESFIGMNDNTAQYKMDDTIWDVPNSPEPEHPIPDAFNTDDMSENGQVSDDEPEPVKYHLRPQTREVKGAFTRTWIDFDKSGNYDPSGKRKARRRQSRVKINPRTENVPSSDEVREAEADHSRSSKVVTSFVITLPFRSEETKAKYRELINALPKKQRTQHDEVNSNGYKLRKRGSTSGGRYYGECNLDKSQFDPNLPENLTGHPAARGCLQCLSIGIRCPLLDDETAWPCHNCDTDNHFCELITPPKFKRTCERCKRRRMCCSYSYTSEHGEACQQCMDDGHACEAGPAKDTIRTRIRYDRDWENNPPAKQKPFEPRKPPTPHSSPKQTTPDEFTMTPAHGGKRVHEEDEGIADMDDDPFVRDRGSFKHIKHTSLFHKKRSNHQHRKASHIECHASSSRTGGKIHKITTRFCHPIIFNHEENDTNETTCHFCSEPSYAILGLEAKEVEVIEWADGRGLDEVSGGHKGEGVENTRVCVQCTTARLPMIMCREHELILLQSGADDDKVDENDAINELLSGSNHLKGKWCSICPNLARWKCCTPGDDGSGCGLLACEHCMQLLAGVYKGDLQKMLPRLSDESMEKSMFGPRADAELLKEDGLLMKYVLWNSQR